MQASIQWEPPHGRGAGLRGWWRALRMAVAPLAVCAMALVASPASAQLSGAIFTTIADGTAVDANIYLSKDLVYLNGGPQNANSAGLPVGTYYFQVTDPSGATLLSSDNAECRQLTVALVGGKGVVTGAAGPCPHPTGAFNPANGSTPVQLAPYDDTPNAGGEYKVWLIKQSSGTTIDPNNPKVLIFSNNDTKTDNFKIKQELPPNQSYAISGQKFYDTNANGFLDAGEPGIPGFKIELNGAASSNTTTAIQPAGTYSFIGLSAGAYGVCEVVPTGGQTWISTTPTSISPINVGPDSAYNNFGNVCLGAGGGKTLGFWSNRNGQAILSANPAWIGLLSGLYLTNAIGGTYDPVAYTDFRSWLLNANAVNMAYMLSAQLAAMQLNVAYGGVNSTALVYAGAAPANCTVANLSSTGFISIANLISAANTSLQNNPNTTASGDTRTCQEFMKNALDRGNNNLNFIQGPGVCTVDYAGTEPKCSP